MTDPEVTHIHMPKEYAKHREHSSNRFNKPEGLQTELSGWKLKGRMHGKRKGGEKALNDIKEDFNDGTQLVGVA